jgi:hypothetical protein
MDPTSIATPEGQGPRRDGDFCYWVEHAQIAAVSWCGQEIIRRLFVTVRDRDWRENAATEWEAKPLRDGGGVALKALHCGPHVEFEWEGTFSVRHNTLEFAIDGRTLRDMEICRLGLVVLYPVRTLLGSHMQTEGPHGIHRLQIQEQLYPQPIIDNLPRGMTPPFSSLSISLRQSGRLQCHFSGDLFELEDQRNWGDASFKAYCTPLSVGFPRFVTSGTLVRHQVEATVATGTPSLKARAPSTYEIRRTEDAVRAVSRFPRLGIALSSQAQPGRESHYSHWSHVRLDFNDPETYAYTTQIIDGLPTSMDLELCLEIDETASADRFLENVVKLAKSRISRILIRGSGTGIPSERSLARLRDSLSLLNIQMPPLFIATSGNFVEINRGQSLKGLDGVAFPFSSTVHLSDRWTVAESPGILGDIVASARNLTGQSNMAISPLALFHPPRARADAFPSCLLIPWTIGTLIAAAKSQVSSLTFAPDLFGALSALESNGFLGRLKTWSDHSVLPLGGAEWEDVYAAYVDQGAGSGEVILANLRRIPIDIRWRETEFHFVRFVDASSGVSVHPQEYDAIQLTPGRAIIAELARP